MVSAAPQGHQEPHDIAFKEQANHLPGLGLIINLCSELLSVIHISQLVITIIILIAVVQVMGLDCRGKPCPVDMST